jgi:DMSO/TMAO reductase YedYZ heme-binding membrane subunit
MASRAWPRFATQTLHRNLSLLAVVFVLAHVVTTLADSYVQISWWSFVLPGTSSYQRWWVALGTVAFDVMAVVVVTSLLRHRLTVRTWRVVHWTSYLLWPLALLHFIGTGTDVAHNGWGLWLGVAALLVVVGGSIVRVLSPNAPRPVRSVVGSAR